MPSPTATKHVRGGQELCPIQAEEAKVRPESLAGGHIPDLTLDPGTRPLKGSQLNLRKDWRPVGDETGSGSWTQLRRQFSGLQTCPVGANL